MTHHCVHGALPQYHQVLPQRRPRVEPLPAQEHCRMERVLLECGQPRHAAEQPTPELRDEA